VKLPNLMRDRDDSIRLVRKVQKIRSNEIDFFSIFQIFMIRFGRIELASYPNKSLDSMVFNAKEALN